MDDPTKGIPSELDRVFDFRTTGMIPPNRVVYGFRAIEQIGAEASSLAKGKVLVVSDETLEKIGTLNRVTSLLSSAGFSVDTFTDVEPEPHVETAEALYEKCMEGDFSLLIGVGGGSVMDVTKLAAQSAGRKRPPRDYVDGKVTPDAKGLSIILIPTTGGTGSEVSPYLVVTIGEKKRFLVDPHYYPDIALIDPLLTVSMPPWVTASTGIDALP